MKKFIIVLFAAVMVFSSCSEESILNSESKSLSVENWYKTAADFEMAINSCYINMMTMGMHGLAYPLVFGVWDDRTLFESNGRDKLTVTSSDSDPESIFDDLFMGVYRTSKVLEQLYEKGVEGIEEMTQSDFDYIEAQAKTLRSMYYFLLVTIYDRPIFYNEENIPIDPLENLTNGQQIQFWDQIEKDLKDAMPKLKNRSELAETEYGRTTRGMAKALLGKAMLYKHYYYHVRFDQGGSADDLADLETARVAFNDIIESKEYKLILPQSPKTRDDYIYAVLCNTSFKDLETGNNIYPSENNEESIWEVQFSDAPMLQNNPWLAGHYSSGSLSMQYFSPHETSYRNIEGNPAMYYEFETVGVPAPFDRDPRCYACFYFDGELMDFDPDSPYYTPILAGLNYKKIANGRGLKMPVETIGLAIKKHYFPVYWEGENSPFNDPTNKRIIRYADVLLMYAEVMYLIGDDGTGLNALNEVRARVDMPEIPALTTEAIIHERDVELAFEYHRWFDLIRWSFDPAWGIDWNEIDWGIDASNSVNPFVVGKNEFLPIPIKEIDLMDGELVQNPGW